MSDSRRISKTICFTDPFYEDSFIRSIFIEDERKWEKIEHPWLPEDRSYKWNPSVERNVCFDEDILFNIELKSLAVNYLVGLMFEPPETITINKMEVMENVRKYMDQLKQKYPDWGNIDKND